MRPTSKRSSVRLREQSLFAIDIRKKVTNSAFKAILGWRDKSTLSKRDLLSVTTQLGDHDAVGS